jgi:transcriptional regulator with XRE-family HTH domain
LAYGRGASANVQGFGLKAVAVVLRRLETPGHHQVAFNFFQLYRTAWPFPSVCPRERETHIRRAIAMTSRKPHPIDLHVGNRLRELRCLAGLSQTALADSVDLTFQQIQKYEAGTNRIAASRLWDFSGVFRAPVESFFPVRAESFCSEPRDPAFAQWVRLYRAAPEHERQSLIRIVKAILKESV